MCLEIKMVNDCQNVISKKVTIGMQKNPDFQLRFEGCVV